MNYKTTILFLPFTSFLYSQEIKAIQGKDSDFFDFEDYDENEKSIGDLIFLKGCSWYCGGSVKKKKASSELKETNEINYSPTNAHDFNKNTAWIEGNSDYGIGEFIEYSFKFIAIEGYKGELDITQILLVNAYKKNQKIWQNNSRVKQLKIYINDQVYAVINLIDSYEIQTIEIGEISFPSKETTKIKFKITEVYKGAKFTDTAISLLMFNGIGAH